jgi:hypothetical protein
MRKGTTAFHNLLLMKNCIKYDIEPHWNLLVGFPGEEEDVYEKYVRDLPLLFHLPPPSGVFPVRFDRFSPYFMQAKSYELDLQPVDYYKLIYPFSQESLSNMAYYFTDRNISAPYATKMIKWLGKMREKFSLWESLWQGPDKSRRPRLFFMEKGDVTVVYDSRHGEEREHRLNPYAIQMLRNMEKPQTVKGAAANLGHIPDYDVEREMADLQERGLVFQEQNRYMSLILPNEPPALSY